jgi:hypothetical protein
LPAAIPALARLPALPGAGRETEDFDLDAAALEGSGEDIRAHRRDRDRTAAHRAGIVDQQAYDGIAELGLPLALVGQRQDRIGDDARQSGGIEEAIVEIEFPGAGLPRH